jgi:hypothetical protein
MAEMTAMMARDTASSNAVNPAFFRILLTPMFNPSYIKYKIYAIFVLEDPQADWQQTGYPTAGDIRPALSDNNFIPAAEIIWEYQHNPIIAIGIWQTAV